MLPEEMLQELLEAKENGQDFNKWESDFIDSIEEQLNEGKSLTAKQSDKIEDMYETILF